MASLSVASLRVRPELALTAFALISGIFSGVFGTMFEPAWLDPIARLFALSSGMMPIGLAFGVALGLGLSLCSGRQWALPWMILVVLIAWSAATNLAVWIVQVGEGGTDNLRNVLAGLGAGAVGALLTHAGATLVSPRLRRLPAIALTTGVGCIAGVIFALGERSIVPPGTLYVIWQPAVAYCMGMAMAADSGSAT
jgi:hypothetical protein